jgi:hypothetical protein
MLFIFKKFFRPKTQRHFISLFINKNKQFLRTQPFQKLQTGGHSAHYNKKPQLLGGVSNKEEKFDLAKGLERLRRVRSSPLVAAGGGVFDDEIDGIIMHITALETGMPPNTAKMSSFSSLTKLVFKRCENAFSRVVNETIDGKKKPTVITLYGAEAVQATYKCVEKRMVDQEAFDFTDLKPLKQFRWLLTAAQIEKVKDWCALIGAQRGGLILAKPLVAIEAGASAGPPSMLVPLNTGTSSSSSSGNALVNALQPKNLELGPLSTKDKKALKKAESFDILQTFFSKTTKAATK